MIIKILHSDRNSWWLYDNVEKARFGIRSSEFVLVSGKVADSSEGDATYDYRVIYVGDMSESEIVKIDYQWARDNKPDLCPDTRILDFESIKQEGVTFINWILARKGDEEKFIIFNTQGFILNDNGKTIERLA